MVTWESKSINFLMADLLSVVAAITGAPDRGVISDRVPTNPKALSPLSNSKIR